MSSWSIASILLVVLVSCSSVPLKEKIYENEQALDNNDQMYLRWTASVDTNTIDFEIQVNCTGWFGISFSEGLVGSPGAKGDIILAGYNDELEEGYVEDRWIDLSVPEPTNGGDFDVRSDVILTGAEYNEPWTIVRLQRLLDTGDDQDIPITPGPMVVGWTFAASDNTSVPHDTPDAGITLVTLIPRTKH